MFVWFKSNRHKKEWKKRISWTSVNHSQLYEFIFISFITFLVCLLWLLLSLLIICSDKICLKSVFDFVFLSLLPSFIMCSLPFCRDAVSARRRGLTRHCDRDEEPVCRRWNAPPATRGRSRQQVRADLSVKAKESCKENLLNFVILFFFCLFFL